MIAFFPKLYKDELLYSVFARYFDKSGYGSYICAAEDLYEQKIWKLDSLFVNRLTDDAVRILGMQKSFCRIIQEHTMYPYYARFLPKERRDMAFKSLLTRDGKHRNYLQMHQDGKSQDRYLRYCPKCVIEDRNRYGETYWHRIHQLYGIDICPRHGCRLIDSDVGTSSKKGLGLESAEMHVKDCEPLVYDNPLEIQLARYVKDIFEADIVNTDYSVAEFLHEQLANTEYTSARGEAVRISKLYKDISTHYSYLSYNPLSEKWRLEKVLQGHRFHTLEIAMIAMLLGIEPTALIAPQKPLISHVSGFDAEINKLHTEGLSYPQIAQKMGISVNIAKPIGEGRYSKKEYIPRCSGGVRSHDWKEIDRNMLPKVKSVINQIWGEGDERPHKVTVHSVAKRLDIAEKRFDNMPICKTEILNHSESYEQYWKREIKWAVQIIEKSSQPITLTAIRKLTNINRNNMEKAGIFKSNSLDEYIILKSTILIQQIGKAIR